MGKRGRGDTCLHEVQGVGRSAAACQVMPGRVCGGGVLYVGCGQQMANPWCPSMWHRGVFVRAQVMAKVALSLFTPQ